MEHERGEAVIQDVRQALHSARVLGLGQQIDQLELALTSSNEL